MKKNLEKTKKKLEEGFKKLDKKIQKNSSKIMIILIAILLGIFILNSIFSFSSSSELNNKITKIVESNKPVEIKITSITCEGCSDINSVVDLVKKQNVKILKESSIDSNSDTAKELISKYNIKKLPTILIYGNSEELNSDKVNFDNFYSVNDAFVLEETKAPYLDVLNNEIKGKVKLIEVIDSSCKDCLSLSSVGTSFGKAGVSIDDWKKVEYNSEEGKNIINKYGIKEIPSMLISKDIDYYSDVKVSLDKLGLEEKQGFYKLHSTIPPYRDLVKNKIVGLVDLIMLTDKSCTDCYDVELNKKILSRLGIVTSSENIYDVSSEKGKELISKYDVKKVPIIILSPEAKEYVNFVNAWKQVGNISKDGWFIMRSPEGLGKIKNI